MPPRRFPPPWDIEEANASCFIVKASADPINNMQLPPKHAVVIFSLGLSCLVSAACSEALKKPTSDEALAVQTSVINCEWKAANRFDDNRYKTIPELVQRVMDECAVERLNARLAFGLSPNDPRIDANEYKDALENIENARKKRRLRP
jgi:hypothetical protein